MSSALRPSDVLSLLDWKRRISAVYADVRAADDVPAAWRAWRDVRDEMFRSHPQSPVPEEKRDAFGGLPFYEYDAAFRVLADVEESGSERFEIAGSAGETFGFTRFGTARFEIAGEPASLGVYWLDAYAGGLFVSFRDATSGRETYGSCRYLLDTVKGAELGTEGGRLVLDFNFAYNPSCAYDPKWACPLAPPDNWLAFPVRAGERYP